NLSNGQTDRLEVRAEARFVGVAARRDAVEHRVLAHRTRQLAGGRSAFEVGEVLALEEADKVRRRVHDVPVDDLHRLTLVPATYPAMAGWHNRNPGGSRGANTEPSSLDAARGVPRALRRGDPGAPHPHRLLVRARAVRGARPGWRHARGASPAISDRRV